MANPVMKDPSGTQTADTEVMIEVTTDECETPITVNLYEKSSMHLVGTYVLDMTCDSSNTGPGSGTLKITLPTTPGPYSFEVLTGGGTYPGTSIDIVS